jgi:hypothetical protein
MQWKAAKQLATPSKVQPVHRLLFNSEETSKQHFTTEEFYDYCVKL